MNIPSGCMHYSADTKPSDYRNWIENPVVVTITGQSPSPTGLIVVSVKLVCPMKQLPSIKTDIGLRKPRMVVTHLP
jgi:hypothetical protein